MRTQPIEYSVDGQRMVGQLAVDDTRSGRRPCVLVCHEGSGLGDNARERTERLAAAGYAAFALDYLGDGRPAKPDEIAAAMSVLRADRSTVKRRARAGLDVLLAQPEADSSRVAAIGFCFGGMTALALARSGADVGAVVSIHGSLTTNRPAEPGTITAKVLVCHGASDPHIPMADVVAFADEMSRADADWQLIIYGQAMHGFTHKHAAPGAVPGVAYDRTADERSFDATRTFLAGTHEQG
jgi:dienelactone hydrolase